MKITINLKISQCQILCYKENTILILGNKSYKINKNKIIYSDINLNINSIKNNEMIKKDTFNKYKWNKINKIIKNYERYLNVYIKSIKK